VPKVLICPSDPFQGIGLKSGYMIFNNVSPSTAAYPVSYGINADVTALTDSNGTGHFDNSGHVGVSPGHPPYVSGSVLPPLNAKLDMLRGTSEILMFADC